MGLGGRHTMPYADSTFTANSSERDTSRIWRVSISGVYLSRENNLNDIKLYNRRECVKGLQTFFVLPFEKKQLHFRR